MNEKIKRVRLDAFKHGMINTRIYRCWINMKKRCNYDDDDRYSRYGGRGIKVCDEWNNSFENFYADMKDTYQDNLTLDRKDINGDYCKENCEWISVVDQNRHTSRTTLTMEKATEIRHLRNTQKLTYVELAKIFNCSKAVIGNVINNRNWV